MAIARRLHHRPVDPRWLEVSPRSRSAASSPSPRFAARDVEDVYLDEVLEEEVSRDALVTRERLFATLLSAFAGGIGGVAMLLVARVLLIRQGALDPAVALGDRIAVHSQGVPAEMVGMGIAAAIGAVVGAVLGRSTWRVTRVIPRVLFFSILAPTLWLFVQVFLIGRMQRDAVSGLSAGPFLAGSLAYALCLAILPALRRPKVVEVLPEK
jgi:hypothetical protein